MGPHFNDHFKPTFATGTCNYKILDTQPAKLIILDLDMPDMNGQAFLENLTPRIDTPYSIIVLTGHGTDEAVKACFKLGINSFLRKPVNCLRNIPPKM